MLNIIWVSIILLSVIYSFFSGNISAVSDAFFSGAENATSFVFKIGSIMIMWQAILNVAQKSGLSKKLADIMSPVICAVFTGVKKGSCELSYIANNITANILGLSNAATPMGIKAMKELSKHGGKEIATDDMCLLAVINSASLQLIPSTLIAMRHTYSSASPGEITIPIWIVSSLTVAFAIFITKLINKKGGKYHG